MLVAANITMQFGAKPLFENVNVKFGEGYRYGLSGANGAGKSTFMKILCGALEASAGNVSKDKHERMAYLKQDQFAYEDMRVLDVVLMGHDGPGHIANAQGKTKVRPLQVYHGKVGRGLSVEMSVKHGPVTLLSVVQTVDGRLKLLVAEGESVPGPILEIGNTNSQYRFSIGARQFVESWNVHGPAHHCGVGVGHIAGKLEKLGRLLQMEFVKVC